jgi:E3 SUMO-protein ligase PIAS1
MVEADGQWHTTDNTYGSREWKAVHPVTTQQVADKNPSEENNPTRFASESRTQSNDVNKKGVPPQEIFIVDSDDEDEGRVKRELSPSYASSANQSFDGTLPRPPQSQQSQASQVIDLTLDSDDDDDGGDGDDAEPVVSNANGKRKADEAGVGTSPPDQLWKKGRGLGDPSRILPLPRVSTATHNGVGTSHYSPLSNNRLPSYQPFQGNMLPPPTSSAIYNYPRSPNMPHRPGSFAMRQNDGSSWP